MGKSKLSEYKAVILAGGNGTRLYPVTLRMAKPLLPIGKKPMVNHAVDFLSSYGIEDIAILTSKEYGEDFEWWKKRYYPKKKITIFKEKQPLGTFGGLFLLKKWVGKKSFFLANGDILTTVKIDEMAKFHKKNNPIATIALVKIKNPSDFGVAVCEGSFIKAFIEKPKNSPSKYVNSGWYLLNKEIFDYHKGLKFAMFEKDVFPKLANSGKLAGFKFQGQWTDCGTWDRYKKATLKW
jgi:NDP-sugar pyrophosphorylase family protein